MSVEVQNGCEAVSRELDARFGRVRDLSPQAREHVASCAACRKLLAWAAEPLRSPETSRDDEMVRRVAAALKKDLAPVKPLPSLATSVLGILGVFALLLGGLLAIWAAQGVYRLPGWRAAVMLALMLAGAATVSVALARQMRPGVARSFSDRAAMLVMGGGLIAGFLALFPWDGVDWAQGSQGRGFAAEGWSCFWPGIAMAVPVAGLLWVVALRGAVQSLTGAGAALGALGGLFGMAALEVSCSNLEAAHLIFSHGGVLVAAAGLGALVGIFIQRALHRSV